MNEQQSSRTTSMARFAVLLASVGGAALLLPGCAVGPNYTRPAINAPATFRNAPVAASTNTLADLQWWELYKDETLNSLIRTALTNNHDLRIAIARVDQAHAIAGQARAQFVPRVGYEGSVSRGRNEFLGNVNPPGSAGARTGDAAYAALNASWEIDLWGRIRRLNESARASFLASEEARHGVRLSLVAEVAQAYFELLELERRLQIANRTTDSFKESARIFSQRLASTAANVPDIERQIVIKENQISVLLAPRWWSHASPVRAHLNWSTSSPRSWKTNLTSWNPLRKSHRNPGPEFR